MSRYQMPSAGVLALAMSVALASGAEAQGGLSAQTAVTLNATFDEALTISATPGVVNFDLLNSQAAGDAPITVEVRATVSQLRSSLTLELYFADPANALTNGAAAIPSERVETDLGGPGYLPCVLSPGSANPGSCGVLQLATGPLPPGFVATRVVNLQIVTLGLALAAGTYTGTLFAQVTAL